MWYVIELLFSTTDSLEIAGNVTKTGVGSAAMPKRSITIYNKADTVNESC